MSINTILTTSTIEYLDSCEETSSPKKIEEDLLRIVNRQIAETNALDSQGVKLPTMTKLHFIQISLILIKIHKVKRIALAGLNANMDNDKLAIYMTKGPEKGTYSISEDKIRMQARMYNESISLNEMKEVMAYLRDKSERVERTNDKDIIAVNNGIFNYKTKTLEDFDPDKYVFITKCKVNYNEKAEKKIFTNPDGTTWDVDSWISEIADDEEIEKLLWEILSAIVRPNVSWDKSAWFYSSQGNNGKGTLCALMRNLCGSSAVSVPISHFAKDFALESIITANAIIVDENDVGVYIDKAADLKAVITGDIITVNRKHKSIIDFRFKGFMIQCLNDYPKVKDRSDSFYRRQLFIPFSKCFTGVERKYIKHQYIKDNDVLEYVLKKVLSSNFYELSHPSACLDALAAYKIANDTVRDFFQEIQEDLIWDRIPYNFLYDLYKGWSAKYNPQGKLMAKQSFVTDLKGIIKGYEWKDARFRPCDSMKKPELLIHEYKLKDWYNPIYTGEDIEKRCTRADWNKPQYTGIVRERRD